MARDNHMIGQHVELQARPKGEAEIDKADMTAFLKQNLRLHNVSKRLHLAAAYVAHLLQKALA